MAIIGLHFLLLAKRVVNILPAGRAGKAQSDLVSKNVTIFLLAHGSL